MERIQDEEKNLSYDMVQCDNTKFALINTTTKRINIIDNHKCEKFKYHKDSHFVCLDGNFHIMILKRLIQVYDITTKTIHIFKTICTYDYVFSRNCALELIAVKIQKNEQSYRAIIHSVTKDTTKVLYVYLSEQPIRTVTKALLSDALVIHTFDSISRIEFLKRYVDVETIKHPSGNAEKENFRAFIASTELFVVWAHKNKVYLESFKTNHNTKIEIKGQFIGFSGDNTRVFIQLEHSIIMYNMLSMSSKKIKLSLKCPIVQSCQNIDGKWITSLLDFRNGPIYEYILDETSKDILVKMKNYNISM